VFFTARKYLRKKVSLKKVSFKRSIFFKKYLLKKVSLRKVSLKKASLTKKYLLNRNIRKYRKKYMESGDDSIFSGGWRCSKIENIFPWWRKY